MYSPILSLYLQGENAPVASSIKYIGHLHGWSEAVVTHCVIILNKEWLFQICHVFFLEVLTCITLGWRIIHWLWLTTLTGQETLRQVSKVLLQSASWDKILFWNSIFILQFYFLILFYVCILNCQHPQTTNPDITKQLTDYRYVKYVSSVFFCHK